MIDIPATLSMGQHLSLSFIGKTWITLSKFYIRFLGGNMKSKRNKRRVIGRTQPERPVLYNEHGAPYVVYSVAAFANEHDLDVQTLRDVLRGHTKEHKGWHTDNERTTQLNKRAKELAALFAESEAKYGVAFEVE
jgi:hypothetical protein